MIRNAKQTVVGLLVVVGALTAWSIPPVPISIGEEARKASHVFVGVTRDVHVVKLDGDRVNRVDPEPQYVSLDVKADLTVDILELLSGTTNHLQRSVHCLYSDDLFSVAAIRRDLVGKTNIFIVTEVRQPTGVYFVPAYDRLVEPLALKASIVESLKEVKKGR